MLTLLRPALLLVPCPACPQDIRNFEQLDFPVYIDPTRTVNWSPALPLAFSTYTNSETQAQSCVGSGVGCNAVALLLLLLLLLLILLLLLLFLLL